MGRWPVQHCQGGRNDVKNKSYVKVKLNVNSRLQVERHSNCHHLSGTARPDARRASASASASGWKLVETGWKLSSSSRAAGQRAARKRAAADHKFNPPSVTQDRAQDAGANRSLLAHPGPPSQLLLRLCLQSGGRGRGPWFWSETYRKNKCFVGARWLTASKI